MGRTGHLTSLLGAVALLGCTVQESERAPRLALEGSSSPDACVDRDGDGYGRGCEPGADCDDRDPDIQSGCVCTRVAEGCACEAGQPPQPCELPLTENEYGQPVCHEGTRYCRDGVWGGCESVQSFLADPAADLAALVDPDCHAPCHACAINCFRVVDPLDPVDGGLTVDNSDCINWATGGGIRLTGSADPEAADCEGLGDADGGVGGGSDGGTDESAGGDGGTDGGTDGDEPEQCVIRTCQNKTYDCGDCEDNDGDGLTDADDPECLGACQNAEDTYAGNIPGQNNAPCKHDCYFDKDSGHGNDDCHWDHRCDPLEPQNDCSYDPDVNISGTKLTCAELAVEQSSECEDTCGPLTPPGCDYFGCCELPAHSGNYVWIGSEDEDGEPSCDSQSVLDADKCHPCTPVGAYFKPCGPCELCAGMTELPEECVEPPPPPPETLYAPSGTYSQLVSFNECVVNQMPDWNEFGFNAHIPQGTRIAISVCTLSSLDESCELELLGNIVSNGSCADDADCESGYCAPDNTCQLITGAVCELDDDCPQDATCSGGFCTYPQQPMDIAGSLSPGQNFKPYIYVEVTLYADPAGSETPALYEWMLTYLCTSMV
jgi:hypothetical protein